MQGDRELSRLDDPDQWARCAHTGTALLDGGGVGLTWHDEADADARSGRCARPPEPGAGASTPDEGPGGLVFDRWCRAYRSRPLAGRVERLAEDGRSGLPEDDAVRRPGAVDGPRGLAVDQAQRLYVAEAGGAVVDVVDLWAQRLLRRIPVRSARSPAQRPVDVAAQGCAALVLLSRPAALVLVEGRRGPRRGPPLRRPRARGVPRALQPARLTARDDLVLVLWTGPDGEGVIATPDGEVVLQVPGATDLELALGGVLVVARRPGGTFARYRATGGRWAELEPLAAPSYDGGALAVAPDGRTAFTTPAGLRWTAGTSARHVPSGRVVTYRLDARTYRTRWGRLFVDACIPAGTQVRAGFVSSDEDEVRDPLPWMPAARGGVPVRRADLTPPLPSQAALHVAPRPAALFRRPGGSELPWPRTTDGGGTTATYEIPVTAPPGRYLWVVLELSGTVRATPTVRALRVERPGHQLGQRLPRSWTRSERDAAFLQRFLAPAEGLLHEIDERAARRSVLLDPSAVPQDALAWLGSLLGLVLDRRWPEPARRALVASAFELFRARGTLDALERLLRLYLRVPVEVVESWRLRGLGGAVLGTEPDGPPAPVVQGAARTSGALGGFAVGGAAPGTDAYTATAHRFTVLIAADLDEEQRAVVRSIVDAHKPAHTLPQVCELGSGMRVGRLLHLGLTAVVGPGSGWAPATVGQVFLGRDGVVGRPSSAARVGESSRVGAVRVG